MKHYTLTLLLALTLAGCSDSSNLERMTQLYSEQSRICQELGALALKYQDEKWELHKALVACNGTGLTYTAKGKP